VVTATTVGYGDISPSTTAGRIIAILLMVTGISAMSMVTASVATYFLRHAKTRNVHIEHIREQLDDWDKMDTPQRKQLIAMLAALAETAHVDGTNSNAGEEIRAK
jgi:voltage-gated potassium channel